MESSARVVNRNRSESERSANEAVLDAARKTNLCMRFEEKATLVANTLLEDLRSVLVPSDHELEFKLGVAAAFCKSMLVFAKNKVKEADVKQDGGDALGDETVNELKIKKIAEERLIKVRAYQEIFLRLQIMPLEDSNLKEYFTSKFADGTLSRRKIGVFFPGFRLSSFFADEDLKSMAKLENIKNINASLISNSRNFGYSCGIPKMYVVMSSHPRYMEMELKSFDLMFKQDGPLPILWRQYVAIMAASRYNCDYLVYLHRRQFLLSGGDPAWLLGVHNAPQKLRRLLNINAILAHQPWLINTDDIAHLVEEASTTFSVPELLLCMCIMSSIHAQAGFICSMGINLEHEDVFSGKDILGWNSLYGNIQATASKDVPANKRLAIEQHTGSGDEDDYIGDDESISYLNDGNDSLADEDISSSPSYSNSPTRPKTKKTINTSHVVDDDEDLDDADILDRLGEDIDELIENDDRRDEDVFENVEGAIQIKQEKQGFARLSVYCGNDGLDYEDFDQKKQPFLQSQEFSWGEQCHAFLGRYYPDLADHLDEQFEYIYEMTYNTFGDKKTDRKTDAFRRAVWYYAHRLLGIRNDDYEYKEVNLVLTRPIKQYLKTACCYPETVNADDFVRFSSSLSVGEKCHINLLLLEARKQAALMYGIRAIVAFR